MESKQEVVGNQVTLNNPCKLRTASSILMMSKARNCDKQPPDGRGQGHVTRFRNPRVIGLSFGTDKARHF